MRERVAVRVEGQMATKKKKESRVAAFQFAGEVIRSLSGITS